MTNSKNRFVAGFLLLAFSLLAACSGGSPSLPPATLQSISVTPANSTLKVSRTLQLTATGHYSYGNPKNITTTAVTWGSSSGLISVGATTGIVTVTGGTAGASATITATDTSGGIINGSTTVTLMPDAFTIAGAGDPLAIQQWHLKNTGQNAFSDTNGIATFDINAEPVYNNTASVGACGVGIGCTGYGVKVAVVDTGLEIAHEDLAANVILNGSWNFNNGTTDPTYTGIDGDHGTSVAGLIASQVYNSKGGMGVAPEASLKGFNFINSSQTTAYFIDSLGGSTSNPNSSDVAIFNQSFGIESTQPYVESSTIVNQYAWGVANLRIVSSIARGALYVKAAGNSFDYLVGGSECTAAITLGISCANANFDPDNVLPYNIVAGALNASGVKSSYSTTGSALWVSAPGGEFGANSSLFPGYPSVVYQPAMVTTDQSSCSAGYSQTTGAMSYFDKGVFDATHNNPNNNASCNYTNTMNGTSSATPVTSGVIALMLEANPNLTWRDVKHILANTPTIKPTQAAITTTLDASYTAEQGWVPNAAGYSYHNWYGFGLVNASAAVAMAKTTCAAGCGLGTFAVYPSTSTWVSGGTLLPATILDSTAAGVTSAITIASGAPAFVEAVQIQVSITHSYWGDLGIELTSPSGTKSILKNIRDGFTYDSTPSTKSKTMLLLSNAFYGETSIGSWTIRVVDGNNTSPSTNTTGGTLTNWQIRIYGH